MESTPNESVFGKIIRGEIPPGAGLIYEDADTIAFLDIHPNNPGHTLVVPKKNVRNIFDMDEKTLESMMRTVQKVAIAVRDGMSADGVNLAMNNEAAAGQVVFHAHMHVIPRFDGDGFKHFPTMEYAPGEADDAAEKIQARLA